MFFEHPSMRLGLVVVTIMILAFMGGHTSLLARPHMTLWGLVVMALYNYEVLKIESGTCLTL